MEVTDTKMDKKITANDIYKTRRIGKPKNNGKPRPLIINFVRYNDRKNVFSSKKLVKDSVVSITESLTAFHMKNLTDARQTKLASVDKTGGYFTLRMASDIPKFITIKSFWLWLNYCKWKFCVLFFFTLFSYFFIFGNF